MLSLSPPLPLFPIPPIVCLHKGHKLANVLALPVGWDSGIGDRWANFAIAPGSDWPMLQRLAGDLRSVYLPQMFDRWENSRDYLSDLDVAPIRVAVRFPPIAHESSRSDPRPNF